MKPCHNPSTFAGAEPSADAPRGGLKPHQGRSTQAYTMVELLVVITVIGILVAILLPAVNEGIKRAEKSRAGMETKSIKMAVDAYYNNYGKMPARPGHQGLNDRYYGGGTGAKYVIEALIGKPTIGDIPNTRNILFLEISTGDSDGTFLDPWGNQYHIQLDTDYNGRIVFVNDSKTYQLNSIVWSMGPDGTNNTGDDIHSID